MVIAKIYKVHHGTKHAAKLIKVQHCTGTVRSIIIELRLTSVHHSKKTVRPEACYKLSHSLREVELRLTLVRHCTV